MTRIFLTLSLFALVLTGAALVVGLMIGDLKPQLLRLRDARIELAELDKQARSGGASTADDRRAELAATVGELNRVVAWSSVHRLLGVGTALVLVFVNSLSVTYFIGTSRWIREVCETYAIGTGPIHESRRIKSRSFPWSLLGIATALGIAALGAAADPSSGQAGTEAWVDWHLAAALGGTALLAAAYYMQWMRIAEHHTVIEGVLAEVARIRQERGLETA